MIDALPLDLFEDDDDGDDSAERPAQMAGPSRTCQWCGAAVPDGAEFCAECGGRVAVERTTPIPGLTELTPEQARAERRPLRRPEPAHWADANDPLALVIAGTAIEIAVDVVRSRRAQRRERDRAQRKDSSADKEPGSR